MTGRGTRYVYWATGRMTIDFSMYNSPHALRLVGRPWKPSVRFSINYILTSADPIDLESLLYCPFRAFCEKVL